MECKIKVGEYRARVHEQDGVMSDTWYVMGRVRTRQDKELIEPIEKRHWTIFYTPSVFTGPYDS